MKPILVLYATREGQTQRIAEHLGASLRTRGVRAVVMSIASVSDPADLADFDDFDAVVLAASVHLQKHEREMVDFVRTHRSALRRVPTAFLSVSMAEAGVEDANAPAARRERDAIGVRGMIRAFFEQTGWHPDRVRPVAGALAYTKYGRIERIVMQLIALRHGASTDTSRDHVFTDWEAIDAFVDELIAELRNGQGRRLSA